MAEHDRTHRRPLIDAAMDGALDWFLKMRAPAVSDEDRRQFLEWLAADPDNADAYRTAESMWRSPEFAAASGQAPTCDQTEPAAPPKAPWRRAGWRYALVTAALAVMLAAASPWSALQGLDADHATLIGQRKTIVLADGTSVVLNTDSAISVDFGPARRAVRLIRGEAYFEIASDAERPFEVEAGPAEVRVVGTAFSVRMASDGAAVAVRRGIVDVRRNVGAPVRLIADQRIDVTAEEIGRRGPVNLDETLAWTRGRLIFTDRRFKDVIDELNRYHASVILVLDDRLLEARVGGNYRLDDPVETVAALAEAISAKLTKVTDRLLIVR